MICFTWNGEAMVPMRREAAAKEFVAGQRYWLTEVSDRSWISHRHEFAWLAEAWHNLPERLTDTFPSPEHLRKAALVATGWHRETVIDAGSRAAALRIVSFVESSDEFADVVTRGPTVIIRKARSQRMHGADRMDKTEFERSKNDIIGWISGLIGVTPEQLKGAA